MPLFEATTVVHLKHPRTGVPLCWHPRREITIHETTWLEDDVSCRDCLNLLQES